MPRKTVIAYTDARGREPFTQWLDNLRDWKAQKRIEARLDRVAQGNLGDCQPVGDGVRELRFHFGPGYRVYFGEDGDIVVLLLCAGDKSSQSSDIERAKQYWRRYQESKP